MRPTARLLLSGAALLAAVSCYSDAPVAPRSDADRVISGNPALRALVTPMTVDFVIPAAGGQVSILDMYTLSFPANAVCDPDAQDSQDGYINKDWNAPCTVATEDVVVHATLKWSYGRLWADFSPALRFVPGQRVMLSTDVLAPLVKYYGADAVRAGMIRNWGIVHSNAIEGSVTDDSRTDSQVRTRIDAGTGRISRRIKHFSGYMIITGEPCVPDISNPFCIW